MATSSMPVFLVIYLIASAVAVILESTMNFKLFAKRKEVVQGEVKETVMQSMKAGLTYLKEHPIIVRIIWISLFINFLFGAFEVGYSFILIEKMKMASQHFGFTEGAFAVGMLIMSIYLSVRKEVKYPLLVGKRGVIVMGAVMGGIALPLLINMPYSSMFAFYATLMFGFGVTIIVVNTPIQVMMQKMIDDDYKGRVFSITRDNGNGAHATWDGPLRLLIRYFPCRVDPHYFKFGAARGCPRSCETICHP